MRSLFDPLAFVFLANERDREREGEREREKGEGGGQLWCKSMHMGRV